MLQELLILELYRSDCYTCHLDYVYYVCGMKSVCGFGYENGKYGLRYIDI